MKVDLSNLKDIGSHKSIKKKLDFPDISFRNQEIETPSPFLLTLDIYNSSDSYILSGELKGKLILSCSRCLEKFDHHISVNLEKEFSKDEIDDPAALDLTDFYIENILLTIPIKPICDEDCKGLCPQCGQNLNENECNCEQEFVDLRLARLKDFFDEDD